MLSPRFMTALIAVALLGRLFIIEPALAAKAPRPSDPCDKKDQADGHSSTYRYDKETDSPFRTYSFFSLNRANQRQASATRPSVLQRRIPTSPTPRRRTCTPEKARSNALRSCIDPTATARGWSFRRPMARSPPRWVLYVTSCSRLMEKLEYPWEAQR